MGNLIRLWVRNEYIAITMQRIDRIHRRDRRYVASGAYPLNGAMFDKDELKMVTAYGSIRWETTGVSMHKKEGFVSFSFDVNTGVHAVSFQEQ